MTKQLSKTRDELLDELYAIAEEISPETLTVDDVRALIGFYHVISARADRAIAPVLTLHRGGAKC